MTDASVTRNLMLGGIQISESMSGCIQGHQKRTWPFVYVAHTIR